MRAGILRPRGQSKNPGTHVTRLAGSGFHSVGTRGLRWYSFFSPNTFNSVQA